MIKKRLLLFLAIAAVFPTLVLAQPGAIGAPILTVVGSLATIVMNATWIIAAAFSVVMFTVAGFKFLTAQGDPSRVKDARDAVIWGTAGVGVIILAWSIIFIVASTLGVGIA